MGLWSSNEPKDKFAQSIKTKLSEYQEKLDKLSNSQESVSEEDKASLGKKLKKIQNKYQKAQDIYEKLKDAGEDTWEEIKDQSSEAMDDLKEAFSPWAERVMVQATEKVVDYGQEKVDKVSMYIRKKPCTAALIAIGLGFILGKMMHSK